MVKKLKLLAAAPLVIGLLGFASFTAAATSAPITTAEIDVTVANNTTLSSTVKTAAPVSGLTATIADASGNAVSGVLESETAGSGIYKFTNITQKGDYYIKLASGNDNETIKATVGSFSATAIRASAK